MKPKVLICTPTSSYKDYCLDEWSKSIMSLTYDADLLILDNSIDQNHCKIFEHYNFGRPTIVIPVIKDKGESLYDLMCRCNNIARDYVLFNKYDYMLSIESDVLTPIPQAIERLLMHKKEAVGFDYFIFDKEQSKPVVSDMVGKSMIMEINVLKSTEKGILEHDSELIPVSNLGLGFVLVKSSVLRDVKFRIHNDQLLSQNKNKIAHADTSFWVDCRKIGIIPYCDTAYTCQHRNGNWDNVFSDYNLKEYL